MTAPPTRGATARPIGPVEGPSGRSPRPLGVLVDGEIVGAWRSRLKGSRLEVTVDPFARLSRTVRDAVTAEASRSRRSGDARPPG